MKERSFMLRDDKFGVKKDDIYGVKFLCYTKHMEKL